MASAAAHSHAVIKIEDIPEPERFVVNRVPSIPKPSPLALDPRDPENFLKRCSGYSKKTNLRCSAAIGKKAQKDVHPTFLPTCAAHRDQLSLAGWCQFKLPDGERCARLLRWTPPYFELCDDHRGHPGTPCYFLNQLPLELRHEIYQYLIPTEPIGSSAAVIHHASTEDMGEEDLHPYAPSYGYHQPRRSSRLVRSKFPMRLVDLLRVSHQFHDEVKDFLFRTVTFKIDVRKDGTFMCGRRLLEPRRADGSSHLSADEVDHAKRKFLKRFAWASVKNYTVDILLENWFHSGPQPPYTPADAMMNARWDEEVELYDIRDYISVVVSGILAKAKKLYKLHVRLCLADFDWEEEQILSATKLLFGPFERLRNIRQPSLGGVFNGLPARNSMYTVRRGTGCIRPVPPGYFKLCSVPSLPTDNPVLAPGIPEYDVYAAEWKRLISSEGSRNMIQEPPLQKMFTEFRNFYTDLAAHVPDVTVRDGRHSFLHRARVAREQEDVIAFRTIRAELIHYWHLYLEKERQKKCDMHARIARFLASDMYPSHVWSEPSPKQQHDFLPGQSAECPVILDSDIMPHDDTPMAGDSTRQSYAPRPPFPQTQQHQQQTPFHPMKPNPNTYPVQTSDSIHLQKLQQQAQQHTQQAYHQAQQQAQQRAYHQMHRQLLQHDLDHAYNACLQPRNEQQDQDQGCVYQGNSDIAQERRDSPPNPHFIDRDRHRDRESAEPQTLDNSPGTLINTPSVSVSPPLRYRSQNDTQLQVQGQELEGMDIISNFHPPSKMYDVDFLNTGHGDGDGDPGPSMSRARAWKKRRLDSGFVDGDGFVDADEAVGVDVAWCFSGEDEGQEKVGREGQGQGGREGVGEEWYTGKGKGRMLSL